MVSCPRYKTGAKQGSGLTFVFPSSFIETRGYSLEDMDGLFGGHAAVEDAAIMKKIRQDVDDLSMSFKTPVV
jgi:hypothetical protein